METILNYSNSIALQVLLRAIAVVCLSIFLWRIYQHIDTYGLSVNLLILAIGELITVMIVLFARFAKEAKLDFITAVSTATASFLFLVFVFWAGTGAAFKQCGGRYSIFGSFVADLCQNLFGIFFWTTTCQSGHCNKRCLSCRASSDLFWIFCQSYGVFAVRFFGLQPMYLCCHVFFSGYQNLARGKSTYER